MQLFQSNADIAKSKGYQEFDHGEAKSESGANQTIQETEADKLGSLDTDARKKVKKFRSGEEHQST